MNILVYLSRGVTSTGMYTIYIVDRIVQFQIPKQVAIASCKLQVEIASCTLELELEVEGPNLS